VNADTHACYILDTKKGGRYTRSRYVTEHSTPHSVSDIMPKIEVHLDAQRDLQELMLLDRCESRSRSSSWTKTQRCSRSFVSIGTGKPTKIELTCRNGYACRIKATTCGD